MHARPLALRCPRDGVHNLSLPPTSPHVCSLKGLTSVTTVGTPGITSGSVPRCPSAKSQSSSNSSSSNYSNNSYNHHENDDKDEAEVQLGCAVWDSTYLITYPDVYDVDVCGADELPELDCVDSAAGVVDQCELVANEEGGGSDGVADGDVVVGSLAKHIDFWETIGASQFVLKIIRLGYALPFVVTPTPGVFQNHKSAHEHKNSLSVVHG